MTIKKSSAAAFGHLAVDYGIILAGCIIYALSVVIFTAPNNIAPGGIVGISTMLNHVFGFLPIGIMTLVLNVPLFIWGGIAIGWRYLGRSLVATAVASVLIDIFRLSIFSFITPYHGDGMLVAIFGGLLGGTGMSLIFFRGGSTGGTDIVSRIMHRKLPHVSIGSFIIVFDAVVIVFAAFVYGAIENSLYAIISIFVSSKVIDAFIYGVSRNNGKLLFIITSRYEEVTAAILERIDRGVTLLDAEGGYNGDEKKVLMCAVRPQQVHKTSKIVREIDPTAFLIVTTANTISGHGFPAGELQG